MASKLKRLAGTLLILMSQVAPAQLWNQGFNRGSLPASWFLVNDNNNYSGLSFLPFVASPGWALQDRYDLGITGAASFSAGEHTIPVNRDKLPQGNSYLVTEAAEDLPAVIGIMKAK